MHPGSFLLYILVVSTLSIYMPAAISIISQDARLFRPNGVRLLYNLHGRNLPNLARRRKSE